jgi:hypothetical protein
MYRVIKGHVSHFVKCAVKKKKDIDIKQTVLYVGNLHHAQQYMHSLIFSCLLHPVEGFVRDALNTQRNILFQFF